MGAFACRQFNHFSSSVQRRLVRRITPAQQWVPAPCTRSGKRAVTTTKTAEATNPMTMPANYTGRLTIVRSSAAIMDDASFPRSTARQSSDMVLVSSFRTVATPEITARKARARAADVV